MSYKFVTTCEVEINADSYEAANEELGQKYSDNLNPHIVS
jgi:hypothetical protein